MVMLQYTASYQHELYTADIEGAFLRGQDLRRDRGELYVEMPRGGVPGVPEGTLVRLVKPVYGLMDAPRAWWLALTRTLEKMGMKQSKLDPCVYYYFKDGKPDGVIAVHVDDLLMAGSEHFQKKVLEPLRKAYPFKKWKSLYKHSEEFCGKVIKQTEDYSVEISQEEYVTKEMKPVMIPRERRRQRESQLQDQEVKQLQGITGSVNWVANQS